MKDRENCVKLTLKRKCFAKGKKQNFKRFKRTPKYVRDNVENQVAKEKAKDVYDFSDSDQDDDDLGMGLELTDLPSLDDDYLDKQKKLIALTQDSVRPFFTSEDSYDESKLEEALTDLRYSSFMPNQKEVIKRILFGRSTLFISPTGSGKSLCYQLPALLYWRYYKYITIVVSPLISLMEDQLSNFPTSLKAISLHSGHNRVQRRRSIEQLVNGDAQVVFISPEAIVAGLLEIDDLKNFPAVGFVCIDEAHCLSDMSHNFRPAYLQFLTILSEQLRIKTFLGLTATATKATSFAIAKSLTVNPETDVIGTTSVPTNLILSTSYEIDKDRALITLLKSPTFRILPSIIIYCNRREVTERVASEIRTTMQLYSSLIEVPKKEKRDTGKKGASSSKSKPWEDSDSSFERDHMKLSWDAEAYHAGLSSETRRRVQRKFIKGELRVVVATVAFGMGINKSNVRAVIHYDMPASFENYLQEIGRAGRDGKTAQCHVFLRSDETDIFYLQRFIHESTTERKYLKRLHEYLFPSFASKPMCRCKISSDTDRLAKLNESDEHIVSSWHKTSFTNIPVQCSEDDLDDFYLMSNDGKNNDDDDANEEENNAKENRPMKYIHKSIVKKHRACKGHEVAFDIEEATQRLNLRPESIITLICQLEQAYPQLQIKQYIPIKSTCVVKCHKGPQQMAALEKSCEVIRHALFFLKFDQRSTNNKQEKPAPFEMPSKIKFDIARVARVMRKPIVDVVRMVKNIEWELVDKTGQFRRSQIKVHLEGNSFHLQCVGDLDPNEVEEIDKFLIDYVTKYECIERNKLAHLYNVFKAHSVNVEEMKDKIIRIETSMKLKNVLNQYFNSTQNPLAMICEANLSDLLESIRQKQSNLVGQELHQAKAQEESIRAHTRSFMSEFGTRFQNLTHITIAKIFQGISTPHNPAEIWGLHRRWWRSHLDVDFIRLSAIIQEELARQYLT